MLSGDQNLLSKKPVKLEPVMKNQDAIRLARFPDGHEPEEGKTAAIEREDWPAPPDPAAAYPELCKLQFVCFILVCDIMIFT